MSKWSPDIKNATFPKAIEQGRELLLEDFIAQAREHDARLPGQSGRHETVVNMRVRGATLREIGAVIGVGPGRTRQIVLKILRRAKKRGAE